MSFEIKFQWFLTIDRSVQLVLVALASLAFLLSLVAIESQVKSPISVFLPPSGTVLNIATGTQISLNELVNLLNEIFGSQKGPVYEPERLGDIKHSRANTRLSKDLLGDYSWLNFARVL